jgi:uncharacterized membrane protein YphA (DoxX/SURF4 family)
MTADDIAILILRLGVAGIYLYAAYQNTKFFKDYTVPETALLFRGTPWQDNAQLARVAAAAGLAVMYVGAALIALGCGARIGASMIAGFTALGYLIHRHRWLDAQAFAQAALARGEQEAALMGFSAYSGHFSSALKNLALIAACATIAIGGPKEMSLAPQWW